MPSLPIEQLHSDLIALIDHLAPGEELVLTRNDQPVATIKPTPTAPPMPKLGSLKGSIIAIAPDFDAIPEGFEEYIE